MQSVMRRRPIVACAAIIVWLGVEQGSAVAQETDEAGGLTGSFVYAGSTDQGRQVIEEAIEEGIDEMGFMKKPVARRRLRAKNQLARYIDIAVRGDQVAVRFDRERTYVTPADGTPVMVRLADGEEVQLSQTYTGERLVQVFTSEDGQRRTVFEMDDGGLEMTTTVTGRQLPGPVRYELDYQRAP